MLWSVLHSFVDIPDHDLTDKKLSINQMTFIIDRSKQNAHADKILDFVEIVAIETVWEKEEMLATCLSPFPARFSKV